MAIEIRRLIFTHSETTAALKRHGAVNGVQFPNGRVIRARFVGGSEFEFHSMKEYKAPIQLDYNVKESERSVILTFFDETTLEQRYFNLTANFISSALIEYCIANQIMLPKQAEKTLDISEFNICLDINHDTGTKDSPRISGMELED